ncbi:hypothetical protein IEQ34_025293 [Dendrobium chrysotoxum]|uniref:D-isomer specific 2-hydroxyacid dehydrogenase NAD-binding domain-containing protein n=1 Tax=Dendrobium chrysotoxum TaxID=161865 RepID=A0AAV7FQZ1_DENCH|nr:hypothetical protein IEQ34_025293 [Dendrobium chrysotoxum]
MVETDGRRRCPTVVLCRDIPTHDLDEAETSGSVKVIKREQGNGPASRDWILANVAQADGLIVTLTEPIDQEIIERAPHLKVISTMSVGTDHIDIEALRKRGIHLGSTPDVLDQAVAELTLMLILNVTRNVARAASVVQRGEWSEHPWSPLAFCGPALQGKTIGFVGFGNIAQSVAALLPAFEPKRIVYTTSKAKPFNIESNDFARLRDKFFPVDRIEVTNEPYLLNLAEQADVVVVLTTLNASTKHLIDESFFARMKPSAILVNTSRGPVVDTDALVRALKNDTILAPVLTSWRANRRSERIILS